MKSTPIKSAMEMVEMPRRPTTPTPPPPPPTEAEKIAAEIEATERNYRAETERLRAEGMALCERRRPANEAVDRLRRLAALVLNARPFVAAARQRADEFDAAITEQLSGGRVDPALITTMLDQNPHGATAGRLVSIAGPWLEGKERELADTITEAKRLADTSPDNADLINEIESIEAAVA